MIEHPAILKRPIMVDHVMKTVLVGYNENDMNDLI
ncbi:MAG: ArsC/Spx/MgsR family protein [Mycoplasmatales bacterium]